MLSFGNLVIILIIILLLFGARRFPDIMTDLARGLKAFKDTIKSQDNIEDNDRKN